MPEFSNLTYTTNAIPPFSGQYEKPPKALLDSLDIPPEFRDEEPSIIAFTHEKEWNFPQYLRAPSAKHIEIRLINNAKIVSVKQLDYCHIAYIGKDIHNGHKRVRILYAKNKNTWEDITHNTSIVDYTFSPKGIALKTQCGYYSLLKRVKGRYMNIIEQIIATNVIVHANGDWEWERLKDTGNYMQMLNERVYINHKTGYKHYVGGRTLLDMGMEWLDGKLQNSAKKKLLYDQQHTR